MDIVLLEGCNGSDTAGGEESGGVSCRNCPEDVSIAFFVLHCFGCREKKQFHIHEIWDTHSGDYEDCHFLGRDIVQSCRSLMTLVPPKHQHTSTKTTWHHITEDRNLQFQFEI